MSRTYRYPWFDLAQTNPPAVMAESLRETIRKHGANAMMPEAVIWLDQYEKRQARIRAAVARHNARGMAAAILECQEAMR